MFFFLDYLYAKQKARTGARCLSPGAPRNRLCRASEAESFSVVSEQRDQTCPIKAQSTAIARAMARICNAEWVRLGVVSG
ncbi:MAG: hypothetical protein CVU22_20935, partial [Betaproteobacteria bacterium HGW-Betaproteobacteria-16]